VVASRLTPAVAVEGGEQASGLATMVADLLRQNLGDSRTRALVALTTRGDVGLTASDHQLSVTVSFLGRSLRIADRAGGTDGDTAAVDPYMAGEWLELAHVCSGQHSPFAAWRTHSVSIEPRGHAGRLAAAGFVLSAPAVGEGAARRRRWVVLVACSIAALSVRAWCARACSCPTATATATATATGTATATATAPPAGCHRTRRSRRPRRIDLFTTLA